MEVTVIGALSGQANVDAELIISLLGSEPMDMSHGGVFTGKPSTELYVDDRWVVKMDQRRSFSTEEVACKWCQLQVEKERGYKIYHPHRAWFVVEKNGWSVGNISPRMQPLNVINFSQLSNRNRIKYLVALMDIYCAFAARTEKRLDEGLSNFALLDDAVWYLDDDIYPWDSFSSFSAMMANWLRKSSDLGLDQKQWSRLGDALKPMLRNYSSSANDMVYEGLSDQFVGAFEAYKEAFVSRLRSAQSIRMIHSAEGALADDSQPIGLIADVHANLPAFKAVLDAFSEKGVDKIMHLGDVVGYGPHPVQCIKLAKERNVFCVRGNHDHYVAHSGDVKVAASSSAKWTLDWTVNQLSEKDKKWLGQLPVRHRMKEWMAVHGSPIDKSFFNGYVYNMTAEKNLEYLRSREIPLCLHGHSHIQGVYAMKGRVVQPFITSDRVDLNAFVASLVCPGSVGQPRDGQIGAEAAVFYPDSMKLELFTVAYEIGEVAREMEGNGFPERIIKRLKSGR